MRYHVFLHYGWFFQNLGKEAIQTFMHRTVASSKDSKHFRLGHLTFKVKDVKVFSIYIFEKFVMPRNYKFLALKISKLYSFHFLMKTRVCYKD